MNDSETNWKDGQQNMRTESASLAHVCLLSTADWNAPLWTNKQFMARELSASSKVLYVGSIGLRRPKLSRRDIRRVVDRLRTSRTGAQPVPPNVTLSEPRILPLHNRLTRAYNTRTLRTATTSWANDQASTRILWTYSPVVYGLDDVADKVVYHAVDLLGSYPGIDAQVIERSERALAERCDVAVASSEVVAEHLSARGFRSVVLWPNVADVSPYVEAAKGSTRSPRRVVFGGNITPYKVDLALMDRLVSEYPDLDVVMCGPTDEGGAGEWKAVEILRSKGVEFPGTMRLDELAELYATASVGIVPYVLNEYTTGVNPLKLFEYLGSGLAVVSTPVPSVISTAEAIGDDDIRVTPTGDAFIAAVADAARNPPSSEEVERRQSVAKKNSWTERGGEARALICELSA